MDFVFHLESKVLQSTRTSTKYEFYNLSMNEFFVAWQIESEYFDEINTTNILYPSLNYYSYKSGHVKNIEYKKCKNYNFSSKLPDDINNYFCIDMSKYSQGGGFENKNKVEYLYMNIDMCSNKTNGNYTCSTKKDFQNLMSEYEQIYMVVYFPTISFVPDEDISYQISYKKKYIPLNAKFVTQDRYYIQKYIFEDDNGWVVPKINTYKLFGVSDIDSSHLMNDIGDVNEKDLVNSFIYYANFYIDRKYSYNKRWFTKAFESLSIIIAFYKTIYTIFHLISSFCNEFLLLQTIMLNTQGNQVVGKITNFYNDNYMSSVDNYMNIKNELSKLPFKYSDNNINILNSISKENNNVLSINKENQNNKSIANNIKKIMDKESNSKLNNVISLNEKFSKNEKIYKFLFLYIFHFLLPKKKKYQYKINYMNRKTFKKKLDIYNYLNLLTRVEFLFVQLQKYKNKKS